MDDSSVFKIADRRAAHTEDAEEPKPAPVQAPPKKVENAGAKHGEAGSSPGRSTGPASPEIPADEEEQIPLDDHPDEYPGEEVP